MVESNENAAATGSGHNYLVCVDGSDASELAFTIAMKALFRAGID